MNFTSVAGIMLIDEAFHASSQICFSNFDCGDVKLINEYRYLSACQPVCRSA